MSANNKKSFDNDLLDEILGDDGYEDYDKDLDDDLDKAIDLNRKASRFADEVLLQTEVVDDEEKGQVVVVDGGEPMNVGRGEMTVEESIACADTLTPQQMGQMLYAEVRRSGNLDSSLNVIERILTDNNNERTLRLKSDEELRDLYQLLSHKQKSSQAFILRMLEMGIKTKILKHLLGSEAEENMTSDGKKRVFIGQEASTKSQKISNLIRNELDKRSGI